MCKDIGETFLFKIYGGHQIDHFLCEKIDKNFSGCYGEFKQIHEAQQSQVYSNVIFKKYLKQKKLQNENLSNFGGFFDENDKVNLLIKKSLFSNKNRFLMMFIKHEICIDLLRKLCQNDIIAHKDRTKRVVFLNGSNLDKDLVSQTYAMDFLAKIKVHIQHGNILIMKDLETIYTTLHDLLNQSYEENEDGTKFCRIMYEDKEERFVIHPLFKCIIIKDERNLHLSKDKIEYYLPSPLLNRMEKYIVRSSDLQSNRTVEIKIVLRNELETYLTQFSKQSKNQIMVHANDLIFCFNNGELIERLSMQKDNVSIQDLVPFFSFKMMILITREKENNPEIVQALKQKYKDSRPYDSLADLLRSENEEVLVSKFVVLTFSSYLEERRGLSTEQNQYQFYSMTNSHLWTPKFDL